METNKSLVKSNQSLTTSPQPKKPLRLSTANEIFWAVTTSKKCSESQPVDIALTLNKAIAEAFFFAGRHSPPADEIGLLVEVILDQIKKFIHGLHLHEFKIIFIEAIKRTEPTALGALSASFFVRAISEYVYHPNAPRIEAMEAVEALNEVSNVEVKQVTTLEALETAYKEFPRVVYPIYFDWLREAGFFQNKAEIRAAFENEVENTRNMECLSHADRTIKREAIEYKEGTDFREINPLLKSKCWRDTQIQLVSSLFTEWKAKGYATAEEAIRKTKPKS